jgi:hypothetical protein
MTFNAPSFFAGVGTVAVLMVAGFGAGVLMSGALTGDGPREPSKVERRAAEATKPPAITSDPVPVVEARKTELSSQASAAAPQPQNSAEQSPNSGAQQVQSPAPQPAQNPAPQQAQSPEANSAAPAPTPQIQAQQQPAVQPQAAPIRSERRGSVQLGSQQPVALVQPPPEPSLTRREARAKAREEKRLEAQRRRAERREFAESRRQQFRTQDVRAGERPRLRAADEDEVEERREERPVFMQRQGPGLFGGPRFRLFGGDDD